MPPHQTPSRFMKPFYIFPGFRNMSRGFGLKDRDWCIYMHVKDILNLRKQNTRKNESWIALMSTIKRLAVSFALTKLPLFHFFFFVPQEMHLLYPLINYLD